MSNRNSKGTKERNALGLEGRAEFQAVAPGWVPAPSVALATARGQERRAGFWCNVRQQHIRFLMSLSSIGNLFTTQNFLGVHLSLCGSLLLKSQFRGITSAFTRTFSCLLPEYRKVEGFARLSLLQNPRKVQILKLSHLQLLLVENMHLCSIFLL